MNCASDQIRFHLLLRQSFTSAEQDRGSESGMVRPDERADSLFGALPQGINDVRQGPVASGFGFPDTFGQRTAHSHEPAICSRVGGKIKLAGIERRRDTCELAEDPQMVAFVDAKQVPLY